MMILGQVPSPPDSESAYAWFAVLLVAGIGALFWKYDASKEARSIRAEKQVDDLTADNKAQTATMRDLANQQEAIVDAVEKAVSGLVALDAKLDAHHRYAQDRLDTLSRAIAEPTERRRS